MAYLQRRDGAPDGTPDPLTLAFTVSGNKLTFQPPPSSSKSVTASLTAVVSRQRDNVIMKGKMTAAGERTTFIATWTLTQE